MLAQEKDLGMKIDEEDWRDWPVRMYKEVMHVGRGEL